MRFGPVPTTEALGAILAHSQMAGGRKIAKGTVLDATAVAVLRDAGIAKITVARLEPGDVVEDAAAAALAAALVPDPDADRLKLSVPHAGRVNLNATAPGIVELDADRIHALNRIDPSLTLATLAPMTRVTPGMLVGTVKVISYAVAGDALGAACEVAQAAIRVRPVALTTAGLVLTTLDGAPDKLTGKAREAVEGRLRTLGMTLSDVRIARHETDELAAALDTLGGDVALILTSAATSDLHDTAPEAVRKAGGTVARFGMPVDPGNLLFIGRLKGRPVVGLPGCARSPALNGADWVLERLVCGLDVSGDDIAAMGVGGLLKEIPIRPQPRERS
ncbi:MAG: molybdopterin-binding protein [Albidovulum sp.]|uniref:molybdopterin-binding protein n=1 Tax=Albidovulum sp. TaxID=1872424 RepID=UPI003C7FBD22